MSLRTAGDRPRHDPAYDRRQKVLVPSAFVLPPLLGVSVALAIAGALVAAVVVALSVATLGLAARMITGRAVVSATDHPVIPIGSAPLVPATVSSTATRPSPVSLAS